MIVGAMADMAARVYRRGEMVADPDAGALRLADGRRTVADLPDLGGGGGGGGPVAWGDVSGKPSTFPPSSHPHGLADLTQSGASTGQVPRWNGSAWAPATPAAGGGGIAETFETVAKNLGAEGATLAYSGGRLASITYASGVTKTLAYDGSGRLASITLSGATPGGIELVKTLAYTGDALTGISYA